MSLLQAGRMPGYSGFLLPGTGVGRRRAGSRLRLFSCGRFGGLNRLPAPGRRWPGPAGRPRPRLFRFPVSCGCSGIPLRPGQRIGLGSPRSRRSSAERWLCRPCRSSCRGLLQLGPVPGCSRSQAEWRSSSGLWRWEPWRSRIRGLPPVRRRPVRRRRQPAERRLLPAR